MEKQKKIEEEEKERNKNEAEEKELFSSLVPPEPDDSYPDKCIIIFRMPDREKNLQRKFLKSEKISALYDMLKVWERKYILVKNIQIFLLFKLLVLKILKIS